MIRQRSLILVTALAALSIGAPHARAGDDHPLDRQGFNELDRNHDSHLSRGELAAKPDLLAHFGAADENGDDKLSRTEYLKVETKKDVRTLRKKAADLIDPDDKPAASGK